MRKRLKQTVAIGCLIFAITVFPFQYIWANFEDSENAEDRNASETILEDGIEYGSLIERDSTSAEGTRESEDRFVGKESQEEQTNEDSDKSEESRSSENIVEDTIEESSSIQEEPIESSLDESQKENQKEDQTQNDTNDRNESKEQEETILEQSTDSILNESDSKLKNESESDGNNQIQEIFLSEEGVFGECARISSIRRVKRITGTMPFDENDTAGNDSSADNNIVRSFDQISYEFELTMAMKETSSVIKTYGGKIYAQAEIPTETAAVWQQDAFQWMEDCQISKDGKKIIGYYKIDDTIQSAPGSQTLSFVIDTNACANNMKLEPRFTFYLEGNEAQEYQSYNDDPIMVSAAPRYNLQLEWDRGTSAYKGIEVELDGERNKLYTVGFGFQLYGESAEKGLKGMEIPNGDLTFEVDVSLVRKAHEDDSEGKNVTEGNVQFLTAKPNTKGIWEEDLTEPLYKELLNEIGDYSKYSTHLPLSSGNKVFASDNRSQQIYHNGEISVQQNHNTVQVRIADYAIDGVFPYRWASSAKEEEHNFTDQIGYISAGNLFYAVALNDETFGAENSNCYLTFEAKNMSVKSISGVECWEDQNDSDQKLSTMHVEYNDGKMATGNYSYTVKLDDKTVSGTRLQSTFENGDGRTMKESNIALVTEVALDASNSLNYAGYSINLLCKFDDECYEPILYQDGSEYALFDKWNNYTDEIKFNVLYAGKMDKTGWNSEEEMAETPMQELIYFDTIQELKQRDYICVGVMYESISGVLKPGSTAKVRVPVHIKKTAVIDRVYSFIGNVRIWGKDNQLDRSKQTFLNPNAKYPAAAFAWKPNYTKTQYDGNGVIIGGHNPGYKEGNSMIIVGGLTSITKSVTDQTVDGKSKSVYDLRNMERTVSYILYPSFVSNTEIEEGVRIEDDVIIEDILPKGLTYVKKSCNYEEPEIKELDDGSVRLKWILKGWEINTEKEPIQYQAEISHTSISGTQYRNKAVIHAPKVDNSAEIFRTDSYNITAINLAGHRIFKEVLKETIETDGLVEYKINYLNMTEQVVEGAGILDILPYNHDSRKTAYHGTYNVISVYPELVKEGSSYEIYGTTNTDIRTKTVEEIDVNDGTWELIGKKTKEIKVDKELTAIYIKGDFQPYEEFTMKISIDPENCIGGDWYYNDFAMKTGKDSDIIRAVPVGVQVREQTITITKRIKADEYYESFGNPFFCFCLEGELEDGKQCRFYRSVEFTKDYIEKHTDQDGYVQISVEFADLASGIYRVTEQKVLRYDLESIDQISSNGKLEKDSVVFQMNAGMPGSAVFTNRISRWDRFTHTTSIINEIRKKQ